MRDGDLPLLFAVEGAGIYGVEYIVFIREGVVRPDAEGCWIWTEKKRHSAGYGQCYDPTKGRADVAHRHSWMLANDRAIPVGQVIRHHCDNRPCVTRPT